MKIVEICNFCYLFDQFWYFFSGFGAIDRFKDILQRSPFGHDWWGRQDNRFIIPLLFRKQHLLFCYCFIGLQMGGFGIWWGGGDFPKISPMRGKSRPKVPPPTPHWGEPCVIRNTYRKSYIPVKMGLKLISHGKCSRDMKIPGVSINNGKFWQIWAKWLVLDIHMIRIANRKSYTVVKMRKPTSYVKRFSRYDIPPIFAQFCPFLAKWLILDIW